MFDLVTEDTIRYNEGADKWKEEFVTNLHEKAKTVTTDNCTMCIGAVYQLEKFLNNPLDTGYQFYSIWMSNVLVEQQNNLMNFCG